MAELAVTDGLPPPADLPRGEFSCTTLADGSIRIDRADPRILISAELVEAFRTDPHPAVQFDLLGPGLSFALVKIHGVNRKVIYRIVDYVPRVNGYIGEWPD